MTGKIFLKLIAGILFLLLLALVTVDYFATNVAKDNYIENLTGQLATKGSMLGEVLTDTANIDPAAIRRLAHSTSRPVMWRP